MRTGLLLIGGLLLLASARPAHAGWFEDWFGIPVKVKADVDGLEAAAAALDRLTKLIEELTDDDPNKGRLMKLLAKLKTDLNDVIKNAGEELRKSGRDISKDLYEKFMLAEAQTFRDINGLFDRYDAARRATVADAQSLIRIAQGVGLSIPARLDEVMRVRVQSAGYDLATLTTGTMLAVDGSAPLTFRGTKITCRTEGYHEVKFAIKDAPKLSLRIGDEMFDPRDVTTGSVSYRVPAKSVCRKFADGTEMLVGFQLVEPGKKARYGGFLQLYPRFPLTYKLTVFQPGGPPGGERRFLESGAAISTLLADNREEFGPVAVAARHGEVYRLAEFRLACGDYQLLLPKDAGWQLVVTFPDGRTRVLESSAGAAENTAFGVVRVEGPRERAGMWAWAFSVTPNEQ